MSGDDWLDGYRCEQNVVPLDDRRYGGTPPLRCPNCGSWWFTLRGAPGCPPELAHGAVTLSKDGRVTAYSGDPVCMDCSTEKPDDE